MVFGSIVWFILMWDVYEMADARDRDCCGWLLFAFIFQPVVAIILLLLLGHNPDYRKDY